MHGLHKQENLISEKHLIAKASWKEQKKAKTIIHVISGITQVQT